MHKGLHLLGRWLVWTIALSALYEILEDAPVKSELIAGGAIAAICGVVAVRLHATASTRYAPNWGDLRHLRRAPANVVRDTLTVGAAILRSIADPGALKGSVHAFPFEWGEDKHPADAMRRATVTLGISIAPNTVVCMMEKNVLIVHRLCGSLTPPERMDPRWPI